MQGNTSTNLEHLFRLLFSTTRYGERLADRLKTSRHQRPALPTQSHFPMSHLLETATRLANSGLAQVTFKNSRGLIVPPGIKGNKITVRVLDAAGKPSGPVKLVSVKDLQLEDLPAPPRAAFMLGAACLGAAT